MRPTARPHHDCRSYAERASPLRQVDAGRADRSRREDWSLDRCLFPGCHRCSAHPEQGFRTCLGILSLARSYDNARVDAACRRGILIKARSVASIRSILKNGLDRAFLDEALDHQPLRHGNIRGQGYFH